MFDRLFYIFDVKTQITTGARTHIHTHTQMGCEWIKLWTWVWVSTRFTLESDALDTVASMTVIFYFNGDGNGDDDGARMRVWWIWIV